MNIFSCCDITACSKRDTGDLHLQVVDLFWCVGGVVVVGWKPVNHHMAGILCSTKGTGRCGRRRSVPFVVEAVVEVQPDVLFSAVMV